MIGPSDQRPAQIVRSFDRRAVRQLTGSIDRRQRVGVVGAELSHRVEILQREPERIHHAVTGETRRIRAVLLEPRPQCLRRLAASVLRQCRDVERRVGRRRAEQAVQYPGATQHGRRAIGIRGQHQDGALAQQAVARLVVERHATEVAALDRLDAVVHRQALVEEGVVRGQQLEHAAIAAQHAVDEQPQFLLEHRAGIQQAARVGELASVRSDLVQLGEVEPLEREIVAQRLGPRVGKHPAHLSGQHVGIAEARFGGELQEFLIRQTAPQEEGQTRRQLQIAQRASRRRSRLRIPRDRGNAGSPGSR